MSRRGAGLGFMGIAAFLYATRFVAAAIYGSTTTTWDFSLYAKMLEYVDQGLTAPIIIALVIGVAYLVWAEIGDRLKPDR